MGDGSFEGNGLIRDTTHGWKQNFFAALEGDCRFYENLTEPCTKLRFPIDTWMGVCYSVCDICAYSAHLCKTLGLFIVVEFLDRRFRRRCHS